MFIKINHTLKLFKSVSHFLAIVKFFVAIFNYSQQNFCKFQFLQFQNYQDNSEALFISKKRLDIWYYYKIGEKTKHIQGSCFDQIQAEILLTVYEIHK